MSNDFEVNPLYEKLITEVREHSFLWDVSHEKYRCKKDGVIAWRNIAKALNVSVHVAQTQWRMLRCIFLRYIKKYEPKTLDEYSGKWRYFHSLWFLRNGLQNYPIKRKLNAKDVESKDCKFSEGNEITFCSSTTDKRDYEDGECTNNNTNEYSPKHRVNGNDRRRTKIQQRSRRLTFNYRSVKDKIIGYNREEVFNSEDELLKLPSINSSVNRNIAKGEGAALKVERNKDEVTENNNKHYEHKLVSLSKNSQQVAKNMQQSEIASLDSIDELFLKSLASFLQKLPPHRKIAVRSRIQDILVEEMAR